MITIAANTGSLTATPGTLKWNNIASNTRSSTCSTTGYVSIDNTEFITLDIPSIFTISKIIQRTPKSLLIQYAPIDSKLCQLAQEGNIYITGAKVFGIYNSSNNFYWNYKLEVEFESEEDALNVAVGDTFTNATQWEKKLTVQEIINMLENKDIYYKYIHKKVEDFVKDQPLSIKIEKHRSIDKLYGFEE